MVNLKMERPQLSAEQLKPLLTVAIVVGLVLAAWFAWNAWDLQRDNARRETVTQSRDEVVRVAQSALADAQKRFAQQLATVGMQQALAAGDLAGATVELNMDWPESSAGVVWPPNLDQAYAALAKDDAKPGGYGQLAVLEAALATDRPVASLVRDGPTTRLALAAPVRRAGTLIGVAGVQLPIQRITAGLETAAVPEGTYLALRQGSASVIERGDKALAGAAEALAAKVPGSDLRIAAAVPNVAGGPLGLGAVGCAIAALLSALLALLAWRGPALLGRSGKSAESDETPAPTLAEAMEQIAPLPAPPSVVDRQPEPTTGSVVGLDRGIFRAYDIRGIVGESLDAGVAEMIGHAVGSLMHQQGLRDIVVGRDGRLSGPMLVEGLITGLRKAGRNVIDIGLAPTPLVYFGAYHLRAGSCVSVTGSHNPPDYNGFKVVIGGETLSGDAITDLYARIAEDRLHTADSPGALEQRDINDDYLQRVASDVQLDRPLKIVVDAGNGVAGELGPRVLAAIGAEVTPLYCEIDGTFPNHHPDPSDAHNLIDLIKMVERLDADLGIAFDGDGDRLGVVTRDGQNIYPDRLLMLFAADVLERNPGALIIYDVKCTGRLPGYILRHGGSPLMWKTGHS
ncbi:MAG TPA: phosphomannomutase/phosphoglucomutase, partial [Lysobacter sp.]